jgi:hypothetical protein
VIQSISTHDAHSAFVIRLKMRNACAIGALALNKRAWINCSRTFVIADPALSTWMSVTPRTRTRSGAHGNLFFIFCAQPACAADFLKVRRLSAFVSLDVREENKVYKMPRVGKRIARPRG